MKISEKGLAIIKKFEGCRLTAYKCPAGVLTIGYGHTGSDVKEEMKITQAKANELLKKDVARFEKAVMKYDDKYHWNQNQFDALVSFTFNCGESNLALLTSNGTRSISMISQKILAYNKAGGKVLEGLVKRRQAEKDLFDTQVKKKTSENANASVTKKTSSESAKYKVTASALNCRDKASMSSNIIGVFKKDTVVELVKRVDNGWYKVKGKAMNGKTINGFCSSAYLKKV